MSAIETYIDLLFKLDMLIEKGKGDSKEADNIRDKMDEPYSQLSQKHIDLIKKSRS